MRGVVTGLRITIALILTLILLQSALAVYTDVLWFRELGAEQRFWTEMGARWGTFALGALVAFAILWGNSLLVRRAGGKRPRLTAITERESGPVAGPGVLDIGGGRWTIVDAPLRSLQLLSRLRVLVLVFLSLILGAALGSNWWTFLLYQHRQPFGVSDPQFGRDVGFYAFTLPAFSAIVAWLTVIFLAAILTTALLYILPAALAGLGVGAWSTPIRRGARHLSLLVAILFALGACRVWISRYELVYSERGPLVGVSAVDAQLGATLLAIYAVILLLLGVTAVVLANRFNRRLALAFIAVWIGSAIIELGIIPAIYEAVAVKPEQLRAELPYIRRHLEMTRAAFGLDSLHVRVRELPEPRELTPAAVLADSATVANMRLADWRPLLHTYNQLQTLRTYYRFVDVDIDRYRIGGKPRAVMLSLRELDSSKVPQAAGSGGWDINRWFIYTHGYGVCMNSINSFSAEGIPDLLIRDLPPISAAPELTVKRPEIYFGELTTQPVMVHARGQQEFDYPRGDDNIFTTYAGRAGIRLGGLLSARRLAFALRFHTLKFFLSSYVGPDTRILLSRDIGTRLSRLAPFFQADKDPYVVLRDDGSLVIVRDLYTSTDRYPYAARSHGISYIRNSVKSTIDCYDGTVRFYIVDESDPLARAYRDIFPELFTPNRDVPPDIRRHFRYPEDLIALQAEVYGTYHVRDPVTFYNHEDVWETGTEVLEGTSSGTTVPVIPYYILMRLPGESNVEFLQMLPLTPRDKDNMIAWVAGRCDPEHYGQLIAFHLPKGTIAYGPRQIEARIDQDATISKDLSLWNQQGSQVLRGNLLSVPIDGSFLYVEPLYIQATGGKIPELKRVIVATQKDVGYGSSLEDALGDLFGASVAALAPPVEGTGVSATSASATPGSVTATQPVTARAETPPTAATNAEPARVRSAAAHLRRYQELMGQGRAAEAGAELDALARDLQALERAAPRSR
jgi:uncharacterized membrane protein (UPF0182 family)